MEQILAHFLQPFTKVHSMNAVQAKQDPFYSGMERRLVSLMGTPNIWSSSTGFLAGLSQETILHHGQKIYLGLFAPLFC